MNGDGRFFVILTFQAEGAPQVEVLSGSGPDATVGVGGQVVRFDGERIILGR